MPNARSSNKTFAYTVYAGYRQFYLQDDLATGSTAGNDFWTAEACTNMLAINPGIIGVGTGSYAPVPVEIILTHTAPDDPFIEWDQVVEASLQIHGTELQVCPCPDPVVEGHIPITPGTYRVRIYYGNLESSRETEEGDDYYRIIVWPAPWDSVRVLKSWIP